MLAIYGNELSGELLEVDYSDSDLGIKISGYVAKPLAARTDKNYQSFFVNNRYVKNQTLQRAVYDAYHSLLFVGKHPVVLLKLTVDPKTIDVNVHPQKTEIKIEQKELLYSLVYKAAASALEQNSLVPVDTVKSTQVQLEATVPKPKLPDLPKYQFEKAEQTIFADQKVVNEENSQESGFVVAESTVSSIDVAPATDLSETTKEGSAITDEKSSIQSSTSVTNSDFIPQTQTNSATIPNSIKLPQMRILGQIHKTFFIAETPGGMLLIDQHVVQERVLYEQYMQEYLNKQVAVQQLLKPEIISLSAMQTVTILQHLEKIQSLGFYLEHFGGNDFSLSTVPTLFGKAQGTELLHIVIEEISDGKVKELERIQEEVITMMSCRASVKAGDSMTIPQITKLLKELSDCRLPYTCPHGRAILIKITAEDLEKKFLRHG